MYYGVPFPYFIGVNPLGMTCRLFLVRRAVAVRAVAKMPVNGGGALVQPLAHPLR